MPQLTFRPEPFAEGGSGLAVTLEQVRAVLMPDEPDCRKAARPGPQALPHLRALVNGPHRMLAQLRRIVAEDSSPADRALASHTPGRVKGGGRIA